MCSRRKRRGNFKNAPRSSSSSFLCKEAFGSPTMLLEKEEEEVEVEGFCCALFALQKETSSFSGLYRAFSPYVLTCTVANVDYNGWPPNLKVHLQTRAEGGGEGEEGGSCGVVLVGFAPASQQARKGLGEDSKEKKRKGDFPVI